VRFRDEFRDASAARGYADAIHRMVTRPWTLMEVCGGQTHAILRFGVDRLLSPEVSLLHGPGCPVCVTPAEYIDKAIEIASHPGAILCSFGDMLRAPGTRGDLFAAKSRGADVRIVYSPLDAVTIAQAEPERAVVFFAVGFETTAPANAMAVLHAKQSGVKNFSMLSSHALVPPAVRSLLEAPGARVQGFLAAGHVCTVMGYREYEPIAERFGVPIVVTGFEPIDILQGVYMCLRQLEDGRAVVENQYSRAVRRDGNEAARRVMRDVFQVAPRRWRGVGDIPESGFSFTEAYADFDAERRFGAVIARDDAAGSCIAGQILRGERRPTDCPAFGESCTPERPLGVTMVSNEGACAAYYRYRALETMGAAP